ncbi:MAG: NAD(+)/NADH kinase [Ktedonobacteraceae bacterium]|nr:NAD(+)/NADH kinase [Ktedonobacteraceae bacterium]
MSEPLVGIIANPASGRDIRRLVAHGTVFDNNEKTAIVRRILAGLQAVGIRRVAYMPEHDFAILPRALSDIDTSNLTVEPLDMPVLGTSADSTRAASMLVERGARCIITLGGDGTNRAVARASGDVPLLPISTGTNNVFPAFVDGTLAGIAAGLLAGGHVPAHVAGRVPCLKIRVGDTLDDYALIDVVVSASPFVGARALWDPALIREVILSRVVPASIGISALGGALLDHTPAGEQRPGMHITLGNGGRHVLATLAPGLVKWVGVAAHRRLAPGESVHLCPGGGTIALDGEREIVLAADSSVAVQLCADGPVVLDVPTALEAAARAGCLTR